MKVRCNWCMKEMDEEDIPVNDEGDEYCPKCGTVGCLMDLTDEVVG